MNALFRKQRLGKVLALLATTFLTGETALAGDEEPIVYHEAEAAAPLPPPNMFGNLLRAYRGVEFSHLQSGDFATPNTSGFVTFRNAKVADNNSALPRDRVAYRYNYFKDATQVNGLGRSGELGPPVSQAGGPVFRFDRPIAASRSYDTQLHTLQLEKTFFQGRFSLEARVAYARQFNSDPEFFAGEQVFPTRTDDSPLIRSTPDKTLGFSDNEFQDIQVILKALLYSCPERGWFVSGGVSSVIPTGENLNVRVIDFSNNTPGDPGEFIPPGQVGGPNRFALDQRIRKFLITNETYELSPFLAVAGTPTSRSFVNGFCQFDFPLNKSMFDYREKETDLSLVYDADVRAQFPGRNPVQNDHLIKGQIRDQILAHLDIGGGYWVYQNPTARYISGLALLGELHYTTTLQDADIITLDTPRLRPQTAAGLGPVEQPTRFGNLKNHVDILDVTLGATMAIGTRATLGTAVSLPLRDGDDRAFEWEGQVQLNVYFGNSCKPLY